MRALILCLLAGQLGAATNKLNPPIQANPVYLTAPAQAQVWVENGVASATNPLPTKLSYTPDVKIETFNTPAAASWMDKLTRMAGCMTDTRYQVHYMATSTTSTNTFILASPTAAGKIIRVLAIHVLSSQGTISGGGIVNQWLRDSATGVSVSTSAIYLPNAAATASPIESVDDDKYWDVCGWPLAANSQLVGNLDKALTGGSIFIHAVWRED